VLSDEVRNTTPFVSNSNRVADKDKDTGTDTVLRLLNALHEVFTIHPPSANSVSTAGVNNDTAFCTAKTVVFQVNK